MLSGKRVDSENFTGDLYDGELLRDIEEISKALYLHQPPQKSLISRPVVRSRPAERTCILTSNQKPIRDQPADGLLHKDKKASVWSWKKPLKALAHIRHHRFGICFFLHVHSIEGLSSNFDGCSVVVRWGRKDEVHSTQPSRVSDGRAGFQETLVHKCSVYGSRSGPHNAARFEPKVFSIRASLVVVDVPGLDLGKHYIDLTWLLPLSMQELEGEECTGEWTTSFRLSRMANYATLNVSFDFSVIRDNIGECRGHINALDWVNVPEPGHTSRTLRRVGSVPSNLDYRSYPCADIQLHHKLLPHLELSKSIDFLCKKFNEGKLQTSAEIDLKAKSVEKPKPQYDISLEDANHVKECEDIDSGVTGKRKQKWKQEYAEAEESSSPCETSCAVEIVDVREIFGDEDAFLANETGFVNQTVVQDSILQDYVHEESSWSSRQSSSLVMSESLELESSSATDDFLDQEYFVELNSSYKATNDAVKKTLNLDDITNAVASDFLSKVEIEHYINSSASDGEPESPRERLLREFEKDIMATGSFILDLEGSAGNLEQHPVAPTGSDHLDCFEDFSFPPIFPVADDKHECKRLLLRNRRKAKLLDDLETVALMRERGLSEKSFQSPPRFCSDGFGSPIELPSEPEDDSLRLPPLGDGFGPCLKTKGGGYLRSMHPSIFRHCKNGVKLIMQASCPVVLPAGFGVDIIQILKNMASVGIQKLSSQLNALMSLDDVTGKTMQQVVSDNVSRTLMYESKSISGQKSSLPRDSFDFQKEGECFQSEELSLSSPCNDTDSCYISLEAVAPLAMDRIETLLIDGLRIQCGLADQEAPSCLNPSSDNGSSMSEFMSLSITLDEWLRMDGGIINDMDQNNERISRIFSAHNAKSNDITGPIDRYCSTGDRLTIAVMVLLRDPLRNYEPAGASMLALLEVEKAPMSLYTNNSKVSDEGTKRGDNGGICMGKIAQVHLAGLNTEPGKEQLWGTITQKQSGTRWLLASGLSKTKKLPSLNSKAILKAYPQEARVEPTEGVLWSITSDIPVTRNPDIIVQRGSRWKF